MKKNLVATLKGLNTSLKGSRLRILILIGLLAVSIMQLQLTLRLEKLNARLGPVQEKSLELYIEPDAPFEDYDVPVFIYETEEEIAI
jgi:hypothetical protein